MLVPEFKGLFHTFNVGSTPKITGVQVDFFPSAKRMFPFSNLNPFPFKPKKSKIREDNFYDMQIIGGWSKKSPPP